MNIKIENYIDFHVLFMTICILIAYEYIMNNSNIAQNSKKIGAINDYLENEIWYFGYNL